MLQFILVVIGVALCLNTIFTANAMPKDSPWSVSFLVASAFASSVGVVVMALDGGTEEAIGFLLASIISIALQCSWLIANGHNPADLILRHKNAHGE